jgi:hypothetical protein
MGCSPHLRQRNGRGNAKAIRDEGIVVVWRETENDNGAFVTLILGRRNVFRCDRAAKVSPKVFASGGNFKPESDTADCILF